MSRSSFPTLREVSNFNLTGGDKVVSSFARANPLAPPAPESARGPSSSTGRLSGQLSPQIDRRNRHDPTHCTDVIADIADMFYQRERSIPRISNYLTSQVEVNEKMRMILVDWLVDVHLKFKLHPESFFLAVDILDRYLAVSRTTRQTLQLVGVTAVLIAAKYEEIFPPEVRDCIHISANTYTRDEILKMERGICAALQFKFTTPTPYPFLIRLLTVSNADDTQKFLSYFFMEHAMLDYKQLQFYPSQIACASLYLANITLRREPWGLALQHYSRATTASFRPCAEALQQFVTFVSTTKYQAVRRKYASPAFGEVTLRVTPIELPVE